MLGQDGGGKRQQRCPQQHVEVEHQQRPVHLHHLLQDPVVVEPDHPDGDKADQVGDIAGPLLPQGRGEAFAGLEPGWAQLDDQ
jgi:hypothetical protein